MFFVVIPPTFFPVAQKDNTMLVGGFLSIDDVNSLYMSAASDTFKTFIADPESTQDKTDRFLRNR